MTEPMVRQSFIQVQDTERDKQTKNSQLFFLTPPHEPYGFHQHRAGGSRRKSWQFFAFFGGGGETSKYSRIRVKFGTAEGNFTLIRES